MWCPFWHICGAFYKHKAPTLTSKPYLEPSYLLALKKCDEPPLALLKVRFSPPPHHPFRSIGIDQLADKGPSVVIRKPLSGNPEKSTRFNKHLRPARDTNNTRCAVNFCLISSGSVFLVTWVPRCSCELMVWARVAKSILIRRPRIV